MSVELSDSELISLWQKGTSHAFELIYKRHVLRLLAVAMGKTGNRELSEEMVQDVFLTLSVKKDSADQIVNLQAYLQTILKNKIFDHYRRNLLLKKYNMQHAYVFNEQDHSTLEELESRELAHQLEEQIEKLPPKCRNVYRLSREQHLANKEIAAMLEISENTVEQHMRKALKVLRTFFYDRKTLTSITALISVLGLRK